MLSHLMMEELFLPPLIDEEYQVEKHHRDQYPHDHHIQAQEFDNLHAQFLFVWYTRSSGELCSQAYLMVRIERANGSDDSTNGSFRSAFMKTVHFLRIK